MGAFFCSTVPLSSPQGSGEPFVAASPQGFIRGPAFGSPAINSHEAAGAAQAGRRLGGGACGAARSSHRHGVAVRSAWRRPSASHARSCAAQGAQRSLQLVHGARPHRPRAGPSTLRALASSSSAGCARGVTRCARAAHALRTRRARCPARPGARPRPAARQRCLARPGARSVP